MIDADIDDAHIASLRMAFFFTQTRQPIKKGHLFLACPPVYRLTQRPTRVYALDDADGDKPIKRDLDGKGKIKVSRFKGLGEVDAKDLKGTAMD